MAGPDIVVAGHICLDMTPKFLGADARRLSEILVPGKLVVVGECVVSTGGPVANTGLALVKLGVDCVLMGKVGNDSFGHAVLEKLRPFGCEEGVIVVDGEQTAYTIVVAPPGIDRAFLHCPGANDTFSADDVRYDALDGAGIFHLGYPPLLERLYENDGEQLLEVYRRARERGVTTSLDMSLPDPDSASGRVDWDAVLRRALPHVDIFLPSVEEVFYSLEREAFLERRRRAEREGRSVLDLIGADECGRLGARLIEYGAGVAALKAGHRGIYVRTADRERLARFGRVRPLDVDNWAGRELWASPYAVEQVASATGAGDCAIAGFLAAFLNGESVERALAFATAAGALNVTAHDAVSGLKTYDETAALLDAMPRGELTLTADGWQLDDALGLWVGPAR